MDLIKEAVNCQCIYLLFTLREMSKEQWVVVKTDTSEDSCHIKAPCLETSPTRFACFEITAILKLNDSVNLTFRKVCKQQGS